MRCLLFIAVLGCRSSDSKPAPPIEANTASRPEATPTAPPKPPDEMDEKMRHCPLALDGAASILADIDGGVRFTVKVPATQLADARRRAHHVVDFAAKRTRDGHGGFDGKGGGRMKNCPVVTDDVTITATDIDGGAQLDVTTTADQVEALRAETRKRATQFPFAGATITLAASHSR